MADNNNNCVMCLSVKRSPHTIDCGHSFCRKCFVQHQMDVFKTHPWYNRCPICKSSITPDDEILEMRAQYMATAQTFYEARLDGSYEMVERNGGDNGEAATSDASTGPANCVPIDPNVMQGLGTQNDVNEVATIELGVGAAGGAAIGAAIGAAGGAATADDGVGVGSVAKSNSTSNSSENPDLPAPDEDINIPEDGAVQVAFDEEYSDNDYDENVYAFDSEENYTSNSSYDNDIAENLVDAFEEESEIMDINLVDFGDNGIMNVSFGVHDEFEIAEDESLNSSFEDNLYSAEDEQ